MGRDVRQWEVVMGPTQLVVFALMNGSFRVVTFTWVFVTIPSNQCFCVRVIGAALGFLSYGLHWRKLAHVRLELWKGRHSH